MKSNPTKPIRNNVWVWYKSGQCLLNGETQVFVCVIELEYGLCSALGKPWKKICSKQVEECDCKLPSLLSLILMQTTGKRAQNNIATNPGEFQKLGTKRYQSDKLSLEPKIIILETLILNSRTKSDSTALLSEGFPSECVRSVCVCGMALELFPAPLRGQAWAIRCDRACLAAAAAVFNTRGRDLGSVQCQSSFSGQGTPARAEGKGAPSLQSWASSAVSLLLLLPFLPSQSVILAPQSNCHTVNLLSPLLQLGSATEGMDYFQKSISIWEHISFWCAGSWV